MRAGACARGAEGACAWRPRHLVGLLQRAAVEELAAAEDPRLARARARPLHGRGVRRRLATEEQRRRPAGGGLADDDARPVARGHHRVEQRALDRVDVDLEDVKVARRAVRGEGGHERLRAHHAEHGRQRRLRAAHGGLRVEAQALDALELRVGVRAADGDVVGLDADRDVAAGGERTQRGKLAEAALLLGRQRPAGVPARVELRARQPPVAVARQVAGRIVEGPAHASLVRHARLPRAPPSLARVSRGSAAAARDRRRRGPRLVPRGGLAHPGRLARLDRLPRRWEVFIVLDLLVPAEVAM